MVASLNQPGKNNSQKSIINIFIELTKNPFILAMIAGLIFSTIDSDNLIIIDETSGLLGAAALPIMLLTIGAKIKVRELSLSITPIFTPLPVKPNCFGNSAPMCGPLLSNNNS